jgi:hypothetical protein
MVQKIIHSTIPLSPYAQENKNKLGFTVDEKLPPEEATVEVRKLNCLSRGVKKITDAHSKPAQIAKLIFVLILAISIVGIPLLALWVREGTLNQRDKKVQDVALEKLNLGINQLNKRAEVLQNIQINNFENLPILDLQGRMGDTDYIDFLEPADLKEPLMKGFDKYKRPFLAIKMKDNQDDHIFITTIFQRYKDNERWTWISEGGLRSRLEDYVEEKLIGPQGEKIFGDIINGRHERFSLAV